MTALFIYIMGSEVNRISLLPQQLPLFKERARLLGSPCEWRQISLACNLIPMQEGECLGILINTITMNFHILERKVAKLKSLLGSAIGHTLSSYRRISQDCRFYNFCSLGSGTHFTSSNLKMYNQCGTTPFAFLLLLWKSWAFGTTISTHLRAILFDSWFLWCSLDGIMAWGMFRSEDLGQSSMYCKLKAIY